MKMRVILVEDEETTMSAPTPVPSSKQDKCCEYTLDGSVDIKGRPAVKGKSGGWLAGGLILAALGVGTGGFPVTGRLLARITHAASGSH
ncbi:hypothetical protein C2845_PM11G29650 [Panicum miliaceum]|uniref:Uncharacterized protein n=1 Tax=Panicum miliaceum TaxID=4540 RepID=A0A3L6RR53_PANMI|nr:hypothetical protein C2845_PM11G29650 [Panicum miliaceum]